MADVSILLCPRVADLPIPKKRDAILNNCDRCKEQIWIMPQNLKLNIEKICYVCHTKLVEECDAEVAYFPASVAHLAKL